ncbi:hypothetical protein D9613_006544 [Agrocybe pediades]|uniref:Uncharacterized protein n=1 Tax=Agrocybe pediades TaxID=84607 RepID=A0A8H4QHL2_9AGAR|nr:hypothetical protein D9613_006544 [Agrocybe pediades]
MLTVQAFLVVFLAALLSVVMAQNQEPIYVPFEWNNRPLSAVSLGSSRSTTTYGLVDGPSRVRTAGPGTLFQSAGGASMHWVNSALPTPTTLSGVCNLASPVAMCTLNVYESTTTTGGRGASGGGRSVGGSSTGIIALMTTAAMGFCIGLAMLR